MNFTDFFIKRPVFSIALSLLLVLGGVVAYNNLTLRQFPEVAANVISISTSYPGASSKLMESFVTTPIENALAGITNLDYMTSESSPGQSKVTLNLKINSDINSAMIDVQSKLSRVIRSLPNGVDSPTVSEVPSDNMSSMIILFTSTKRSIEALSDYLKRVVIPDLSNLDGVAEANVWGRLYAMRIWLDTHKMQALGVSASDVQNAIAKQNVQSTPGEIKRTQQLVTIDAKTDLHTAKSFNNLVIKNVKGHLVRLHDIGYAKLGALSSNIAMYANGQSGVGVGITYKSDANPLTAAKAVKNALAGIQLPSDMKASIARDNSIYIEKSIEEVLLTFAITIALVVFVIFVFLGSIRLVFIPFVTIPLSVCGAFLIMYALNYSINTLTLLALVLAIGMVVDDAIVVMENVHRHHVSLGTPIRLAAINATRQICFAIIGMTITLMAVYAPLGFTSGLTGALFREFAFTLASAVLFSGLIGLTLTPMMCSKLLRVSENSKSLATKIDRCMLALSHAYKKPLTWLLEHRSVVLLMMFAVFICGVVFLVPLLLTSGMAPSEDQGVIFGIAEGPSSASLNYTQKYTRQIGDLYSRIPEKQNVVMVNGVPNSENQAMTILTLKDWSQRKRSAGQILNQLRGEISAVSGLRVFLVIPPSLPGSNSIYPFQFVLTTTGSYEQLADVTDKLMTQAKNNPNILSIRTDLHFDQPEFSVNIDRNKAGYLGVSMQDIDHALSIALGQPETNEFSLDGYAYYVIPQLIEQQHNTSNILNLISVKTASNQLIPLSTLITVSNTVTSNQLNHFQGQRSATIDVQLNPNYSTRQAINYFSGLAKQFMSEDMNYDFSGQTRLFLQTSHSMLMIFLAALVVIYLVLAAQFESFRDPLVVMVTVPLAIAGALGALLFSGGSLNVYTEIGMVTLIGLISKHGILLVEFAKQCRLDGMSVKEAISHAAVIRLRPILMTTATMVLGSVPLILAHGAGATARQQLGWTIAGGMVIGTFFTLFILPTIYLLIPGKQQPQLESE